MALPTGLPGKSRWSDLFGLAIGLTDALNYLKNN